MHLLYKIKLLTNMLRNKYFQLDISIVLVTMNDPNSITIIDYCPMIHILLKTATTCDEVCYGKKVYVL